MNEKTYKIKEMYYTLQGEGYHTGRGAVFCRFAGCNLWSGLEKDRATAICKFCDTDFWGTNGVNGGKYNVQTLVEKIITLYPPDKGQVFVVFTGGEPALQIDEQLTNLLKSNKIYSAIETNGTLPLPTGIDWICVSPKADTEIVITKGDELKLVYPQDENQPELYKNYKFDHFYLQPKDDENQEANIKSCVDYCMQNPQWKLSLQTHKILNID